MRTTLMIECDIKHAPEILLAAQKIINREKEEREVWERRIRERGYSSLNAAQWYNIPADEKTNYIVRDSEGQDFDIAIFNRADNHMRCELCQNSVQKDNEFVVGTPDTREPKYCFYHYLIINKESRFIKKGVC